MKAKVKMNPKCEIKIKLKIRSAKTEKIKIRVKIKSTVELPQTDNTIEEKSESKLENESENEFKISNSIELDFKSLQICLHDETQESLPELVNIGFKDLKVISKSVEVSKRETIASMTFYANSINKNKEKISLMDDWNCEIILNQSKDPQFAVTINSEGKLNLFISDLFVAAIIKNTKYWVENMVTRQQESNSMDKTNSTEKVVVKESSESGSGNGTMASIIFKFKGVELVLVLKENPFCRIGIENLDLNFNQKNNGISIFDLKVDSIKMDRILDKNTKQFTKMLCPFDDIKHLLMNSQVERSLIERKESSMSVLSVGDESETESKEDSLFESIEMENVPELHLIQNTDINGKMDTTIELFQPCGFLLPGFITDIMDFVDMRELISVSTESEEAVKTVAPQPKPISANINIKGAKFILLEEASKMESNAMILDTSLLFKHKMTPNIDSMNNKCEFTTNMEVCIPNIEATICPASLVNQNETSKSSSNNSIHTIIKRPKSQMKLTMDSKEIKTLENENLESDITINATLPKLDLYFSFIDSQIIQNVINTIQESLGQNKQLTFQQKLELMIPNIQNMKESFNQLIKLNYCPELAFTSVIQTNSYEEALEFGKKHRSTIDIRIKRGEIKSVIDLLPLRMYHNFKELMGKKDEKEILEALIKSKNNIKDAKIILGNENLLEENKLSSILSMARNTSTNINVKEKKEAKDKKTFVIVSNGLRLFVINDKISNFAVPYFDLKLDRLILKGEQSNETLKTDLNIQLMADYYNQTIMAMEPLLEDSEIKLNVNIGPTSNKQSSKSNLEVNLQLNGIGSSNSREEVSPVNINLSYEFISTFIKSLRRVTDESNPQTSILVGSWKPFYIVNCTREVINVWESNNSKNKQMVMPDNTSPLQLSANIENAFNNKIIKYNKLNLSFIIGSILKYENILISSKDSNIKTLSSKESKCVILQNTRIKNGTRYIYIYSSAEIRNHSNLIIDISITFDKNALRNGTSQYWNNKLNTKQQSLSLGTVNPGESVYIPVSLIADKVWIQFKPKLNGWESTSPINI